MSELIGYDNEIQSFLNNYKSKSLHSSIIIHGPKGIGKRLFIDQIIEKILHFNFDKKNYLHHLNLYKNIKNQNIKIIEKNIDSKTKKLKQHISIDQIRNVKKFIRESTSINNLEKFVIVDSVDDLNINSANSFLKSLEEPNNKTFIFLISHQLSALLPTIRSRCLKIRLNKHSFENFREVFNSKIPNIDDDEITFLYQITYGSPGNAISLYDNNILEIFNKTLEYLNSKKLNNNIINLTNSLSKLDNDKFKIYLSLLKSTLVILNKIKSKNYPTNQYVSNKHKILERISQTLSINNIIDRFNFLVKNENDLFAYNLDKKIFMLKFLTN